MAENDVPVPFIGDTVQVSFVSSDLHRGLDHLVALGIGPFQVFEVGPASCTDLTYMGKPADFSMRLAFAFANGMMYEVVEPGEGPTIYQDFLDAGHTGLHHIAVSCNNIPYEERAAGLEARGYKYIQGGKAFGGVAPFGYFHNGDPTAPIVEIFHFPEGFAPEPVGWYPNPPAA